jgi:transmembrane sensor
MADKTPNVPPADDAADWDAIARYHAGESTPQESAAVQRWLAAHPAEAAALDSLNDITGNLSSATPPGLDVEAALRSVHERRSAEQVVPIDTQRAARRPAQPAARRWQRIATLAAASIVLAVGARMVWHSARDGGYTPPSSAAQQTYATAVGQRDSIRLPDGTRVVLAPESEIRVARGYGGDMREVELRGEAYFDVHHDEERPFLVRAGGAAIRDLGTTFTVRATSGQSVRVAVTSGTVSLAPARAEPSTAVVLKPGDAGTMTIDGRMVIERAGAVEADTAWARGRLVFREAPVSVVRDELRRWYGIDLQMDSAFASRHLSMTFDGEPADRVLEVIALSLGGELSRQGNTASIKPGPARAR